MPDFGSKLAARPEPVAVDDRHREHLCAAAKREHPGALTDALEAAIAAARALREDRQHLVRVEDAHRRPERLEVRGLAVDGVDRGHAERPAGGSPLEQLALPSQLIGRSIAWLRNDVISTGSALEAWFAATISGPVFGIEATSPSLLNRTIARTTLRRKAFPSR